MKWKGKGKAIGFLLGLLTRRWQLALLGLAVGHLLDIGVFSRAARRTEEDASAASAPLPPQQGDPYQTLGVLPGASDDDVELAYRRAMSEYHPDRVASAAREIRDLAGLRAREINGAYEEIKRRRGL
jgi:DnaJ-domain-containing protein 1